MKSFLLIALCACSQIFGFFSRTTIGNSELIGSLYEGILIPLPEMFYTGTSDDRGSWCLHYKSLRFPEATFRFIRDVFDYPLRLEEYADWFTQQDCDLFPFKQRQLIYGGLSGNLPMLFQKWENHDGCYYQLFIGRGREGFACTTYLPKPSFGSETLFWDDFFRQLPYSIDMSR